MDALQVEILAWFAQFAYEPTIVYLTIITLLVLSSFGLPIPEEVTLLGSGLVVYMGMNPEFPPPTVDATPIAAFPTAMVCLFAVFLSDFLVYSLGKKFGTQALDYPRFQKIFTPKTQKKVRQKASKYGMWACAIFRFLPGLRFPGHFMCGALGIKTWKFIVADGSVAILSVPTQVLLIAYYGETILANIEKFKFAIFIGIVVLVIGFIIKKRIEKKQESSEIF